MLLEIYSIVKTMNCIQIIFFVIMILTLEYYIFNGFNLKSKRLHNNEQKPNGSPLIVNDTFWSNLAESFVPKGLSFDKCVRRARLLQGHVVKMLSKSTMGVCGRQLNAIITLDDGTNMCAKYRGKYKAYVTINQVSQATKQTYLNVKLRAKCAIKSNRHNSSTWDKPDDNILTNGEALTFYLSRLLHMDNVPIVILVRTNATSNFWKQVNISSISWEENKIVTLTEWINYASRTRLPQVIYDAFIKGEPITGRTISTSNLIERTPDAIAEIVQWGNMILLDFLIAHLDRYVRFNFADDENRHIPSIESNYTKNVIQSKRKIWLIDNESTFFLSYFIKCRSKNCLPRSLRFYEELLKTICVFQQSVVSSLMHHLKHGTIYKSLLSFSKSFQPLESDLEFDETYSLVADILDKRVAIIVNWIRECRLKAQK